MDGLVAKLEGIGRGGGGAKLFDLLARPPEKRLAGADRGAPGFEALGGSVVAHIAFHHQIGARVHLGHPERAGEHAVIAGDAARFSGGLDHSVGGALNGIGRANFGTGRRIAVHADHRHGLRRLLAVDIFQVDHRLTLVGRAFGARLDAGLTPDAARRVDEKSLVSWDGHGCSFSGWEAQFSARSDRVIIVAAPTYRRSPALSWPARY